MEVAQLALYRYHGNVGKAVEVLLSNGGVLPPHAASSSGSSKLHTRKQKGKRILTVFFITCCILMRCHQILSIMLLAEE